MVTVTPTGAERTLAERAFRPFQQFAHEASAGGIVLLACTVLALIWANSPWASSYVHLWEQKITVGSPGWGLSLSLHHWINDGLMAVFFFVVGLEIKREFLVGELASVRQAAFPMAGAVGGMVVPALIYVAFNAGGEGAAGWGIPMATDIAFALGVLALLGSGVPLALKVFLAALAIVDDIGAVLVIALFYSGELSTTALGWAGAIMALLVLANLGGVRNPVPYALLGLVLWAAVLESGIHATVAGVLLALTIPSRTRIDAGEFSRRAREALAGFESASRPGATVLTDADQQAALRDIERLCEAAQAPLLKLETKLHGVVAFGIMPLFALANAGVRLEGPLGQVITDPIAMGIVLGLAVGKPLGITLLAWLAVRIGLAARPAGVSWMAVHAVSWLAGIGFTMSLFIGSLAFASEGPLLAAKIGILAGSLLAGVVGALLLRSALARMAEPGRAI